MGSKPSKPTETFRWTTNHNIQQLVQEDFRLINSMGVAIQEPHPWMMQWEPKGNVWSIAILGLRAHLWFKIPNGQLFLYQMSCPHHGSSRVLYQWSELDFEYLQSSVPMLVAPLVLEILSFQFGTVRHKVFPAEETDCSSSMGILAAPRAC